MFKPMKEGGVVQCAKSSRHRAAKIVTFSESMTTMISLVNLSKAVSVEWNFRYAD